MCTLDAETIGIRAFGSLEWAFASLFHCTVRALVLGSGKTRHPGLLHRRKWAFASLFFHDLKALQNAPLPTNLTASLIDISGNSHRLRFEQAIRVEDRQCGKSSHSSYSCCWPVAAVYGPSQQKLRANLDYIKLLGTHAENCRDDIFDQIKDGPVHPTLSRRNRKLQSCKALNCCPYCCQLSAKALLRVHAGPINQNVQTGIPTVASRRRLEEEEETGSHLGEVRSLEGDINQRCKHLEDEVMERVLSGNYTFAGWEAVLWAKVECDLETVGCSVPVAAGVQAPVPVAAPVHPGSLSLDDYKASRGCCNGWNKNKEKNAEDEWKAYEKEYEEIEKANEEAAEDAEKAAEEAAEDAAKAAKDAAKDAEKAAKDAKEGSRKMRY